MVKKERASYTVEAAFVVPIILGLIFVVFYMVFLLHDKVVLQANLENTIFLLAEKTEMEEEAYEKYLSEGLWFFELEKVNITNKKTVVKGDVKGCATLEIPVLNLFMNGEQEITVSEKYYKIQPEEIIRYGSEVLDGR